MNIIFSEIKFDCPNEYPDTYLVSGHPSTLEDVEILKEYALYLKTLTHKPSEMTILIQHFRFGQDEDDVCADANHIQLIQAFNEFAGDIGDDFTNQDGVEWLDNPIFTIKL